VIPGPGSSNEDGCVMWLVHLFFANAKANARVARIASMRKKEKEEKKRKHHESEQHCSHT